MQVDDRGPGKKGFIDSLPLGREPPADPGRTLNLDTIQPDLDHTVALGLAPSQELQANPGRTLNLETIHSELDDTVTRGPPPGRELQADRGGALNPDTTHSDLDSIVTLELPPSQELQADRGGTLNLETIHSELDATVIGGLPGLELNLHLGKLLPASWQANFDPGIIVPNTDDTPVTALPHGWLRDDDHPRMLPSTNPALDDDDEANATWKLVCISTVLLFFSWIVQSWLGARKGKIARLKFEPNASRLMR